MRANTLTNASVDWFTKKVRFVLSQLKKSEKKQNKKQTKKLKPKLQLFVLSRSSSWDE